MWPAIGRVNAYWVSVSTFIFTTPYESASRISSSSDPDPPWNTSSNGVGRPTLAPTASWMSLEHGRAQLDVARLVDAVHVSERSAPADSARSRRYRGRPLSRGRPRASCYSLSLISPTHAVLLTRRRHRSRVRARCCAAAALASNSCAIARFSGNATADPSHMCDWKQRVLAPVDPLLRDREQRSHVAVELVLRAVIGVQRDVDRVLGRHHVGELGQRHGHRSPCP